MRFLTLTIFACLLLAAFVSCDEEAAAETEHTETHPKSQDDCHEHSTYQESGSPISCHKTCENHKEENIPCTLSLVPSCKCDDGYVLHDGKCVEESTCEGHEGHEHKEGEEHKEEETAADA